MVGSACLQDVRRQRPARTARRTRGSHPLAPLGLLITGPDRALFLPGGLLAREDVPLYLDGTLPGE